MGKLNAINQLVNHRQFSFRKLTNTHSIPIKLPRTFKMDVGDSLVYCPVYAVRTPLSYISHQASFYSAYPQNDNTGIIKLTSIQPFFGAMGCTSAIVFTCFGAAYGTAKSGVGICAMGVLRPDLIVKNIVPVIMAGIIGIYGLVVSV